MKEGRKRKVVIKDAKVTDAGMYACISNADKTEAELIVHCELLFIHLFIALSSTPSLRCDSSLG